VRVQEFRSSGVQEFRSSGVQEFRSSGVQEFRIGGCKKLQEKRYLRLVCETCPTLSIAGSRTPVTPRTPELL
jgi:hypothetical protein